MGIDAIDPIEPPPQGDVELADVRRRYGKDLVLFGNLEIADLESTEPAEFEKVVDRALIDGTSGEGKGFVLMPSSAPNGRKITPRMMANYETMVRLATRFPPITCTLIAASHRRPAPQKASVQTCVLGRQIA